MEFIMELDILHFFADLHGTFFDKIVLFITHLGDAGLIWIALALFLLCFKKYRKSGAGMTVALLFSLLFTNIVLKNLVARQRPFDADPTLHNLTQAHDFSFPSGHTSASIAAALSLLYYHKREGIIALVVAILISISRIYVCVHYPTDVLGGVIVGIVSAVLSVIVVKLISDKMKGKENV
ncbi:MAG: phosphatase PAP2 family protein [Lachnospiraceae bacterium]|nr:phosphatase PAP2 family protein [Lachnospiraceae bacterium]